MAKHSATGTRTRVARVRAEYPNQLDYSGFCKCADEAFVLVLCSGRWVADKGGIRSHGPRATRKTPYNSWAFRKGCSPHQILASSLPVCMSAALCSRVWAGSEEGKMMMTAQRQPAWRPRSSGLWFNPSPWSERSIQVYGFSSAGAKGVACFSFHNKNTREGAQHSLHNIFAPRVCRQRD